MVKYADKSLSWNTITNTTEYKVLKNGKEVSKTTKPTFAVAEESYGKYQVIAVDANGVHSLASEPVIVVADNLITKYELENYASKSAESIKDFQEMDL